MNAGGHRPGDRQGREDLLGRLQAADPARALPTDAVSLRAAVDRRIAEGSAAEDPAAEGSAAEESAAQGPEDSHVGGGRSGVAGSLSPRHWMLAAVLAAALAVGGYALGIQRAQPPVSADQEMAAAQDAPTRAPEQDTAEGAGQQESMVGDSRTPPADAGRSVFVDGGLPTQTGHAEAWALDAAPAYQVEVLAEIAADLGLRGEVQGGDGAGLEVTDADRSVRIEADGLATFIYQDEAARESGAPTDPEAAAGQFLDTLGVDTSASSTRVQDLPGSSAIQVSTVPEGHAGAGTPWQITVTEGGVSHATGPLARPQSLGEYPTISAAAAIDRLTDPAFDAGATPLPQPVTRQSAPPAVPDAGSPLPWPVREVEFTGATLGVAEHHVDDGRVLVLPTWSLDAGAAGSWQVLAVEESALDTG